MGLGLGVGTAVRWAKKKLALLLQLPQADPVTGRYSLGQWTDGRASDILVRDFEGIYRTIPGGVMPLENGRVVKNLARYSRVWQGEMTNPPTVNNEAIYAGETCTEITWVQSDGFGYGTTRASHVSGSVLTPDQAVVRWRLTIAFSRPLVEDESIYIRLVGKAWSAGIKVDAFHPANTTNFTTISELTVPQSGEGSRYFWMWPDSKALDISVYVYAEQYENVTGQSNQNPSEYVPVLNDGSPMDGLAYFNRENGNTVGANGIVTEAPGALISPEPYWVHAPDSTNLVDYSDDATQWGTIGDIVIARKNGVFIAGRQAFEISGQTALWHYAEFCEVLSQTGKHVATIFIAAGSTSSCRITLRDNTAGEANFLDFTIGSIPSITQPGASVPEYISHKAVPGGYLYTVALTPAADGNDCCYRVSINTTVSTDTILVAGAQVEAKSFATPLIETNGAPAGRDIVQMQHPYSSEFFNQSEGVLISRLQIKNSTTDVNTGILSIRNSPASLQYESVSVSQCKSYDRVQSATAYAYTVSPEDSVLIATRWSGSEKQIGFSINGNTWKWSAVSTFNGDWAQTLDFQVFRGSPHNRGLEILKIYNKDMGTQWIEDNF